MAPRLPPETGGTSNSERTQAGQARHTANSGDVSDLEPDGPRVSDARLCVGAFEVMPMDADQQEQAAGLLARLLLELPDRTTGDQRSDP